MTPNPLLGACSAALCYTPQKKTKQWPWQTYWLAMLVFFSAMAGFVLREWKGCRPRTWTALAAAIMVFLVAVALLTYGNYLGSLPAASH